jgi:uncharacterized protein
MAPAVALSPFILKVASRCNLDCSYCYVYNKADTGWRGRPALMPDQTFDRTLERIAQHIRASGQQEVELLFHGGEPTLVGPRRFASMCERAEERLADVALTLSMQTNGTRLTPEWAAVLRDHDVRIGVSLDGPKAINDVARVDRRGRGSYDTVAHGIEVLRAAEIPFAILSVVQLGADPLYIHRHFVKLGCVAISYLLPAYTHDEIDGIRARYGPTPCADYLIPIFDEWWADGDIGLSIREFWEIGRTIMGGRSQLDAIGNPPIRFVSIESDGSIHGLDKLRACKDGLTNTDLGVFDNTFAEIAELSPLHSQIMQGLPLPSGCRACPERETCAGGYVAHRYSSMRQFDNPSVWCADLLALYAHMRGRMGVSHEETSARRDALTMVSA